MMHFRLKQLVFLALMVLVSIDLDAQKEDAIWLFGDDKAYWPIRGGMDLYFDTPDTPVIHTNYRNMDLWAAQASICDSSGKMLMYTNGCDIFNGRGGLIENGDNINAGIVHNLFCDDPNYLINAYVSNWQSMLILPQPNQPGIYYLFHLRILKNVAWAFPEELLYTKVDMNANLGAGKVLEKNVVIMRDSFPFGELSAVRHGNGNDWWVVIPKYNSGKQYVFKFTESGITDTLLQQSGDGLQLRYEGSDQSTFSPDGSKVLRFQGANGNYDATCQLRSFDRLTGQFTAYKSLNLHYDTLVYNGSCAISPSGQFGYIVHSLRVYQIDLWATDIEASQVTVGWYDGFKDPVGITFGKAVLGPDCKIYITGSGDTKYMHTIHRPDVKGVGCNVELRSLVFPWPRGATIPFPPNYRLGPIDNPGDPCFKRDTSTSTHLVPNQPDVSIWPNPFAEEIKVQTKEGELEQVKVFDLAGRLVTERNVLGGITHVHADAWPMGCYFIQCLKNGQVLSTYKVVKTNHEK
jgi:Secretion system C-terminal sorting domain